MSEHQAYETQFIPTVIRIGQITLALAIVLSLLPPLYLSFGLGHYPGYEAVLTGFLAVAAFAGAAWVTEPISYFPILGTAGTYMSFLSGNIGNMRVPVAGVCQNTVDAELGSHKAEMAAVMGIAVSVLVNLIFVIALILIGQMIVDSLPKSVIKALTSYTLPSIFAAMSIMFLSMAKDKRWWLIAIAISFAIIAFSPFNPALNVAIAGLIAIVVVLALVFGRKSA